MTHPHAGIDVDLAMDIDPAAADGELLPALLAGLSDDDARWVAERIEEHRRALADSDAGGDAVAEPKWRTGVRGRRGPADA